MTEEQKGGVPPKATPGAPRPITVRLKPVVPKTDTQKTVENDAQKKSPPIPKSTVVPVESGLTSRVPIPSLDEIDKKIAPSPIAATVKLRPVRVPGAQSPVNVDRKKPIRPVVDAIPTDSHKPGSNPLPPGPKPPSEVQVQAAKSKTSRISLDSAIGVAPDGPINRGAPKTIRLKRPATLAGTGKMPTAASGKLGTQESKARTAPIGKTSRIPDAALENIDDPATVTQKKTLKIRKKSVPGAADDGSTDFEGLTPISDLYSTPVKGEGTVFTTIAGVAAIVALIISTLLVVCLGAQAVGPTAGKNDLASLKAGVEIPWPGAIVD